MPFVYSTLACDNLYTEWDTRGDLPVPICEILVKGGSGIASLNLITPLGVRTEVTDKELAILENHPVFKIHKKNGFIVIDNAKQEPDKVARLMNDKDKSKPRTPADYVGKKDSNGDLLPQPVLNIK